MGVIIWAGVPSTSVGVVIERYPAQPGPSGDWRPYKYRAATGIC